MHFDARLLWSFVSLPGAATLKAKHPAAHIAFEADWTQCGQVIPLAARSEVLESAKTDSLRNAHHNASAGARANRLVAFERCVKIRISGVRQQHS